jgi:hypothetical protein
MGKKLTIEFIREQFEKEGYTLLSTVYKNNRQKLDYICPRGHRHSISWTGWKQNQRCPCFSGLMRPTIEFIRAEFKKEGYELLSTIYEDNHSKLDYICSRRHKHSVCWAAWNSSEKVRCPYCAGNARLTIEFIRSEFEKEGYTLLTTVYKNNKQKLEYVCSSSEKHKHSIRWDNWKSGGRCPECSIIKRAIGARTNIEFIRAEFEKEGYTLLTKVYKNNEQKLEYICSMGHHHSITWRHWNSKEKRRCPFCSNVGISKWEKTIKSFLGESNIDYVGNDKTQLINPETRCSLELDIWMPKLNKAIECNGIYWHKDRQHIDLLKQQLCKEKSIDLLVITDKEWNQDTDKCKTKLMNFIEAGV